MLEDNPSDRIVIFADASANWVVAGLRQIERIIFAIEEAAADDDGLSLHSVDVVWASELPVTARRLPARRSADRFAIREMDAANFEANERCLCLTTRLLVVRGGMSQLLSELARTSDLATAENELVRACAKLNRTCRLLANAADISAAESWFMRSLGKAQDGFVARYFDRRISTQISRALLHFGATPVHATILGFLVGLAGCFFLLRGAYASILEGMLLLYAFSILDGCDGEIARAKYLESTAGQRLDLFVDVTVSVLFFIALGVGLAHVAHTEAHRIFFLVEGLAAAMLTIGSEAILAILAANPLSASPANGTAFHERHAEMLGHSGVFVFGRRAVHATVQLTKRDVSLFLFVILAALNVPAWILHLSLGTAFLAASVASLALIRRPTAARAADIPRRDAA
ncbi:MAG: CDP-alcohol phosphatidyltransferase family protein [Chthoniobacterales bacterium]